MGDKDLGPPSWMIDSPQGYCRCGDVGEVMHKHALGCAGLAFARLGEAAVRMNKALSTLVQTTT